MYTQSTYATCSAPLSPSIVAGLAELAMLGLAAAIAASSVTIHKTLVAMRHADLTCLIIIKP